MKWYIITIKYINLVSVYFKTCNCTYLLMVCCSIFDGFKGCVKDCFLQRVDKCVDKIINITTDTFNNAAALKQSLDKMCTITDQLPWGKTFYFIRKNLF